MIQYFDFHNYNLSSGKVLEKVRLAYTTEGELSANKDNAILVFHALTGSHMLSGDFKKPENIEIPWNDEMTKGWWTDFVGPKKMFDTEKYFIVCANYLGGCYGSTGPSSINPKTGKIYGKDFPEISFFDIEDSQRKLLDSLGVRKLHAVVGGSIGGLMALEFASNNVGFVSRIISISSGSRLTTLQKIYNLEQAELIRLGRNKSIDEKNSYLALARMIAHKTYVSLDLLDERAKNTTKFSNYELEAFINTPVESYMMHQGAKFVERFESESYLRIIGAWQKFEFPEYKYRNLETVKVFILGVDSDVCFYKEEQEKLHEDLQSRNINSTYKQLKSNKGHDSFLLEPNLFKKDIERFLS